MKAASALLFAFLAACSASAPSSAPSLSPSPSPSLSPSPSPAASGPCASDSAGDHPQRKTTAPVAPERSDVATGTAPLGDGMYIAFLSAIDVRARTASADVAQWFSGEAAQEEAAKDGQEANNDYYIRNQSKYERAVPLACPVAVTVARSTSSLEQYTGSLTGLAASLRSDDPYDSASPYRGRSALYWLTVSGGAVTKIEEQYVP